MHDSITSEFKVSADSNAIAAVEDLINRYRKPEVLDVQTPHGKTTVLIKPKDLEVENLKPLTEQYLDKPVRRKGTAQLHDLKSFVGHVNRFKDDDSVLFADDSRSKPSITAVLDYHRAGADSDPRFGEHRAVYDLPLSDEWKAWSAGNGESFNQLEFASFLEDRIVDVLSVSSETELSDRVQNFKALISGDFASPNKLMQLSVGLSIAADERVTNAINLQTGESKVSYSCEHKNQAGQEVSVPKMFMIGIPVFKSGVMYQIAVRLRYRVRSGAISWFYELYQTEAVFDDAVKEACVEAEKLTELPLLIGRPE